ncbi:MAG: ComEC/Rec2 family competence protein [Bacteroidetes bacterium]|nr:ComEC/Rec2 family competence protein [Bacteroidota bacterium]MDA1267943.1 ComEC/Rec2 family competence protein [Bacteroidota bacterium]
MTFADFPFLRYLFFFFGGLYLIALFPNSPPQLFLGLLISVWLVYAVFLFWFRSHNSFLNSGLAYLLLIGLGCYVSLSSRQEALEGEVSWGEGQGYLAEVQRYDLLKANSSENLLSVFAINGANGWRSQKALVLVYHQLEDALYPGQVIWVPANPEPLAPPSFPDEFNYKRFLATKGIHFRQFIGKKLQILPLKQSNELNFTVEHLRHYFAGVVDQYVLRPESKQIALALLLGQKESLGKEVKQAYSATGTQHILAVSGLHVGIIYSLLLLPLSFFKQKGHALQKSYLMVIMGLIWIYALMTGFSPSVVRAVVMFSLVTLGQMRKRKPSIWNILAFSALLLLVLNPEIRTDLGFQLSYLAVAGIVGLQPIILRIWAPSNRVLDYFWQMASVTLAAQLVTSPLTLHYFHTFPTYFLVANLLIVPLSYIILCAGVPFLLLAWIPVVGSLLGAIVDFLLFIQNEITYALQNLPAAVWQGIHLPLAGMLALWGILWIWGNWELGNRKTLIQLGLGLGLLWAITNLWAEIRRPAQELYLFTEDQQRILDLRLGEHHLSWNQDFPAAQLSYSILPNRLASQRNPVPIPLRGIAGKDSVWFPGIDITFFPAQNRIFWGSLQPKNRVDFNQVQSTDSLLRDSIFQTSSGFRVIF